MKDAQLFLEKEKINLTKHVTELYSEFYDKVMLLSKNNSENAIIDTIESLYSELYIKINQLELEFAFLCVNTLSKEQQIKN
jgi:hypothetical protein